MAKIIKLGASLSLVNKQMENGESEEQKSKTRVVISGIANATTVDRIGDLIPKTAWQLDNYLKNPVVLWEHNGHKPIGKVLEISPSDEGLVFTAEIGSETEEITECQEECISLLRQGIVKTFSVGFIPHSTERKDDVYLIKEAELLEISLVSVPMNQDSLLTSIKSMGSMENTEQVVEEKSEQTTEQTEQPQGEGAQGMDEIKEMLKGCHGKLDKMIEKMFPADEEKPAGENSEEKPNIEQELSALKEENAQLKSQLEKLTGEHDALCKAIVLSRVK